MASALRVHACVLLLCLASAGCGRAPQPPRDAPHARNLLIVTIDTLRADRLGAYGYRGARTPAMDVLAAAGVRFDRAFAPAPITLTSHASLLTGRYPPGHDARHNGLRVRAGVPTLAEALSRAGFSTGAFVAAFPLDRRFGLARGFEAYEDGMPRGDDGRPDNERRGEIVVDEALEWLARHRAQRFFLWVHLFEPHAPYGNPLDIAQRGRPVQARYDDEVAEADRQTGRLVAALGPDAASTLVVLTSDHGEAFGEHGEIGHSLFVYDTTLRVPLVLAGPGVPRGLVISDPVTLVDVAPTVARLLEVGPFDADGIDLRPAIGGQPMAERELYAESFAPLFDFGWSPLRALRSGGWKFVAAPRPELYDLRADPSELHDLYDTQGVRAAALAERVQRYSPGELTTRGRPDQDAEAAARLQALGYASGSLRHAAGARPDPKDRRELAARIARVTSGEVQGRDLELALQGILRDDPSNPQANVRLGYVLLESNRCARARHHFEAAIAGSLPGADAHLGLAACQAAEGRADAALAVLREAERREPGNPVVVANVGIILSDAGRAAQAVPPLERAVALDPGFNQARFHLAIAYGRAGRREQAAASARELLRRLAPDAPQRAEVERLLAAVQ